MSTDPRLSLSPGFEGPAVMALSMGLGAGVSIQSPVPWPGAGSAASPSFPPRLPPSRPACRCRAVIYFNIQVVRGQQRIIRLLKEQIANVRELCTLPLAGPGSPGCSTPWSSPGIAGFRL